MKAFSIKEISLLLKIMIPLVLTGFIEASVGFFSTVFLAHIGTKELAAGAIVIWIFVTLMVVLWGTLTSVSVLVAQNHGAKDSVKISYILRDGLLLALLFMPPAMLLLWNIKPILLWVGQDPVTVKLAEAYMHGLVWGVPPDFIGLVLMQFLIGLGHTRTNLAFTLLWVPLNIAFNYVLIFGELGLPALGIVGIGWGTTIAYWVSTAILFFYLLTNKRYAHYLQGIWNFNKPHWLHDLCHIGLPMGIMYCIEIGYFLLLTLLMGHISSEVLAANQITLQYLGELSVVTFSIAQAVTVRIGHALGANKIHFAARAAYLGISIAVMFMLIVGLCYLYLPDELIGLDLNTRHIQNANIVAYAKQFLAICAIFQLLEAVRFTLFGALRGLKDTRFTLFTSTMAFWGVSFPIGYWLAMYRHMGGVGFWWGMLVGATFDISLLLWRFRYKIALMIRAQQYAAKEVKPSEEYHRITS
jgi:MATE family multidrug resistance protein